MDKKLKFGKEDLIDIVKSSLIAVVSSLVLVLIFAIIIKFTGIEDNIILVINMIIKSLSIVVGILFGIKNARLGAVKGLCSGLLFILVSYVLFAIINLDAKIDLMMIIDSLIILVESLIAGIIAVNIKDKRAERR
ncbi:MAG: TIGR04086 family membrane protein [Clostridia bacterium]|nr:TIGR04086 family membrane protein [Clostridia bacterium]